MPNSYTGINIRTAVLNDAAGIAGVHNASWRSTYRGIVPQSHLDALDPERRTERWRDILTGNTDMGWFTIVTEEAGLIVGFASAGPTRSDDPGYSGELGGLYLLASHQRQGIGRRMVTEVARRLREQGIDSMIVWVLRDNTSRGFYEALGGGYIREQIITIGGADLVEVAYGWKDTAGLI